jgi:hypothetical protein
MGEGASGRERVQGFKVYRHTKLPMTDTREKEKAINCRFF